MPLFRSPLSRSTARARPINTTNTSAAGTTSSITDLTYSSPSPVSANATSSQHQQHDQQKETPSLGSIKFNPQTAQSVNDGGETIKLEHLQLTEAPSMLANSTVAAPSTAASSFSSKPVASSSSSSVPPSSIITPKSASNRHRQHEFIGRIDNRTTAASSTQSSSSPHQAIVNKASADSPFHRAINSNVNSTSSSSRPPRHKAPINVKHPSAHELLRKSSLSSTAAGAGGSTSSPVVYTNPVALEMARAATRISKDSSMTSSSFGTPNTRPSGGVPSMRERLNQSSAPHDTPSAQLTAAMNSVHRSVDPIDALQLAESNEANDDCDENGVFDPYKRKYELEDEHKSPQLKQRESANALNSPISSPLEPEQQKSGSILRFFSLSSNKQQQQSQQQPQQQSLAAANDSTINKTSSTDVDVDIDADKLNNHLSSITSTNDANSGDKSATTSGTTTTEANPSDRERGSLVVPVQFHQTSAENESTNVTSTESTAKSKSKSFCKCWPSSSSSRTNSDDS